MSKILLIEVILHFKLRILGHCYFKQLKSETTKIAFYLSGISFAGTAWNNIRKNFTYFSLLKKVCLAVVCVCLLAHALAEESEFPPIDSGKPVKSNFTLCLEAYCIKIYV